MHTSGLLATPVKVNGSAQLLACSKPAKTGSSAAPAAGNFCLCRSNLQTRASLLQAFSSWNFEMTFLLWGPLALAYIVTGAVTRLHDMHGRDGQWKYSLPS